MVDVPLDPAFAAFGVPVTVTPPDGGSVETTGFWVANAFNDIDPVGQDRQRRDPRRILVLGLTSVLRGSAVLAPPPGGTTRLNWVVDNIDRQDGDHVRVLLRQVAG